MKRSRENSSVLMICSLIGLLLAVMLGNTSSGSDTPQNAEFLTRYKEGLAVLKSSYGQIRASGVLTEEFRTKGVLERVKVREIDYLRNGDKGLIRLRDGGNVKGKATGETVVAMSPGLAFRLKRPAIDAAFTVLYLGKEAKPVRDSFKLHERGYLDAAYSLHSLPIEAMLGSPGFVLKRITTLDRGGQPLFKIAFDYRPVNQKEKRLTGWWTVAPHAGWAVQEFEADIGGDEGKMRGSVEYRDEGRGAPIPRHITVEYDLKTVGQRHLFEFDRFDRELVPEREFMLAAFGLEGLDAPAASSSFIPAYLLFGAGLLFLVASIALKIASKSRTV